METRPSNFVAGFPFIKSIGNNNQALVQTPISLHCQVCVIVPVRNEADTLFKTLTALLNQVDLSGNPLDYQRYEIILLLNNCDDNSVAIARDFARQYPDLVLHILEINFPPRFAYIGKVRQILMDEAYLRFHQLRRKGGVIASTDGDSQVSANWIAATLYEIDCGADAVGGRIMIDKQEREQLDPYTKACYLHEVGYRYLVTELESYLDPDPFDQFPRHYQHYGASFAVTAEMYAIAGGLPPVRTPEDVALYQALVRVNARFRHSPLVKVTTSARQVGRTDIGLANQLQVWEQMGNRQESFLVESPKTLIKRFSTRQQLRQLWSNLLNGFTPNPVELDAIANGLMISSQWLKSELSQPHTFGQLWNHIEQYASQTGVWTQYCSKIEIRDAIAQLRVFLNQLRQQ